MRTKYGKKKTTAGRHAVLTIHQSKALFGYTHRFNMCLDWVNLYLTPNPNGGVKSTI
jgi:hypothetical protein